VSYGVGEVHETESAMVRQPDGQTPVRMFLSETTVLILAKFGTASTKVYPKVSGLAAWSENCKWYSSLSLGTVVSLFCESV